MATARQRQRKLARAQFHQHQSRQRRAVQRQADAIAPAMERHVRRSAVITVDESTLDARTRVALEGATVAELRTYARQLGVRRTSLMRKGALVESILAAQ